MGWSNGIKWEILMDVEKVTTHKKGGVTHTLLQAAHTYTYTYMQTYTHAFIYT